MILWTFAGLILIFFFTENVKQSKEKKEFCRLEYNAI
jgi:hypothetical protein